MKEKPFVTLLITVIVLGGIIIGVFAGGIALGKNQGQEAASQDMQNLFSSRFAMRNQPDDSTESDDDGTESDTEQPLSPGGFMGRQGMGTVGTVTSVEDNVITVETMRGSVSVVIAEDTSIQKMGEGSLNDILPGVYITVSGETADDGSIQASSVFMMPQGLRVP